MIAVLYWFDSSMMELQSCLLRQCGKPLEKARMVFLDLLSLSMLAGIQMTRMVS